MSLQSYHWKSVRPALFVDNVIRLVKYFFWGGELLWSLFSHFLESFLHHKSYDIGMMGFSVFVHAFPVNTNHLSPQPGPKARFSDTVTLSFFKFLAKTRK